MPSLLVAIFLAFLFVTGNFALSAVLSVIFAFVFALFS